MSLEQITAFERLIALVAAMLRRVIHDVLIFVQFQFVSRFECFLTVFADVWPLVGVLFHVHFQHARFEEHAATLVAFEFSLAIRIMRDAMLPHVR